MLSSVCKEEVPALVSVIFLPSYILCDLLQARRQTLILECDYDSDSGECINRKCDFDIILSTVYQHFRAVTMNTKRDNRFSIWSPKWTENGGTEFSV